jgi:hypothetical protein
VLLSGTLFLYLLLAPPPHRIVEAPRQLITEGITEPETVFVVPPGMQALALPMFGLRQAPPGCRRGLREAGFGGSASKGVQQAARLCTIDGLQYGHGA